MGAGHRGAYHLSLGNKTRCPIPVDARTQLTSRLFRTILLRRSLGPRLDAPQGKMRGNTGDQFRPYR